MGLNPFQFGCSGISPWAHGNWSSFVHVDPFVLPSWAASRPSKQQGLSPIRRSLPGVPSWGLEAGEESQGSAVVAPDRLEL